MSFDFIDLAGSDCALLMHYHHRTAEWLKLDHFLNTYISGVSGIPKTRTAKSISIQCIRKVFKALHFFHIVLSNSLIPKMDYIFFIFLKIIQTTPHNDDMKEVCYKSLLIYENKK